MGCAASMTFGEKVGPTLCVCAALLLAGCDGLSNVGEQNDSAAPPTAAIVVLNQPFEKNASGDATSRVRAGTEVFLSGKDSDGQVAPVLDFEWTVTSQGGLASPLTLIQRNNHTVSFTAPMVTEDVTVRLALKVTDAKGGVDDKEIAVTIVGIPDGDQFLAYNLDYGRVLKVVPVASRDVAPAELTGGDVEFEITLRRLVDYTTPDMDGPYLEVGSEVLRGRWDARFGVASACDALENPSFTVRAPAIDVDDILSRVDPNRADLEPNQGSVDDFNLKMTATIRITAGAFPSSVQPLLCVDRIAPAAEPDPETSVAKHAAAIAYKRTDPTTGSLELTLEEIMGAADSTQDTRASATAYYAAIDRNEERTTLLAWMRVNGFIAPTQQSYTWENLAAGADAHAVYTNNYDLGFGRDMYARIVRCDGARPALGAAISRASIGACDIAAVVVNYTSLEAATKKLNPVLVVAMEYSKPATLDRRIVQFYTFAPDNVTGEFRRVLSANLDGRGEKYMPQVCTVCHGGTPAGVTAEGTYAQGGDVGATFLPWDLDAFLFADAEGQNADRSYGDDSLRSRYTRSAQADALRRLNQLAYLTYADAQRPHRFVLPRQLVEGWYGAQGDNAFVNSAFNGQFTPAGWTVNGVDGRAGTPDDNHEDAPALYHEVFARNCRACHIAHAPAAIVSGDALELITGGGVAHNACDPVRSPGEPAWRGASRQLPIACYRQFVTARNLASRLSDGVMPFARLTMDRFWLGQQSSAQALYAHLNETYAQMPEAQRPILTRPGEPSACIRALPSELERGVDYLLDGSCSKFAQGYRWLLEEGPASATLAFDESPYAVLRGVTGKGDYVISLQTSDTAIQRISRRRADAPIQAPAVSDQVLSPEAGQNVRTITVAGSGGDGGLQLASVASAAPGTLSAEIADSQTLRLTALNVTSTPVTVSYTLADADGDVAAGALQVSVKAGLAANSFTAPTPASVRRTGQSGAPLTIELLPEVTYAIGQALVFEVDNSAGLQGANGVRATVTVDAATGSVSYTSPPGTMSQFRTGATNLVTFRRDGETIHDVFTYTVRYRDDPTTLASASVTAPIEGNSTNNVSFQSLYADSGSANDLDGNCATCHSSANAYPAYKWFIADSARDTYCELRTGTDVQTAPNFNNAYVDLDDPEDSALYQKPRGELEHQGAGIAVGTSVLHGRILQWIREGGHYTPAANQDCPP